MSEPDIRIGDTEREEALRSLGEHMSAGRLELDEYGDRSALVTTAKTRRDLLALFADLPEPHPRFGQVARPAAAEVVPKQAPGSPLSHRLLRAAVPLGGLIAVALFLLIRNPLVFLMVPAIAILAGSVLGDDGRRDRHRDRDRRRRS
ncbi:DUF1707 domain-containing protein [Umezawaea sp. NPDC059074]|uniref:DUF1707 SHOCT-like domain-containing protein n=1 Tax=Umezawaea sp. NPDC059074 TaxID=3346716 RepID=UPI0036AC995D